mgnify:CR=1 FL=1
MKNHLLLMMGGSGTRLGADRPKQYIEVEGMPIFAYILEAYDKLDCIDTIVIVSHSSWFDYVEEWKEKLNLSKRIIITGGGTNRSESVKNGLIALEPYAEAKDSVLLHDATHPYVDKEGTEGVIEALKEYEGATLGAYQYDTVYKITEDDVIEKVIPRQLVVSGASPEAFIYDRIYEIYCHATDEELEKMTSAGAIALEHGIKMKVVPANLINLKITYKNDMDAFKKIVKSYFFEEMK